MRKTTRVGFGALALLVAATLSACGGDEQQAAGTETDSASAPVQKRVNLPPVIESVSLTPWEVGPGDVVSAEVETHDPEDQDVKLGFVWHLGDHRFPGGESSIEIPSSAKRGDIVRVTVTASDSLATSKASHATTEIANTAPVWREISLERHKPVVPGSKLTIHAIADDHDGDELTLDTRWFVNKRRVKATGAVFDTSELKRGDVVHAEIVADDGDLETPERETEGVVIVNSDPSFVSAPGRLSQDGSFEYQPELTDADGDRRFRFSLAAAPPDMTIDSSFGNVSWVATEAHQGFHRVEIVARDLHGGEARQRFELTVKVSVDEASPAAPDQGESDDDDDDA